MSGSGGALAHLEGLLFQAQPILLGARKYWSTEDLYPGASLLVGGTYGILAVVWLWTRRSQILGLWRLEIDRQSFQELAGLVLLAATGVFVFSSFGALARAPRYLLPSYVGIFMVAAFSLDAIASSRRWLANTLLGVLLTLHLTSAYVHGRQMPGEPIVLNRNRVAKSHTELIDFLVAHDLHWVRTDYWIGHRLAFESKEQVKFISFGEHRDCRVPEYCARGADPEFTRFLPLVLVNDQVPVVRHGLERRGFTFKLKRLSGYILLYDIQSRHEDLRALQGLRPQILASHNQHEVARAMDGDLQTRWGTGAPQEKSMWFEVRFAKPRTLRGLLYSLGAFAADYPRLLGISAIGVDGKIYPLFAPGSYNAARYLLRGDGEFPFYFDPFTVQGIRFEQVGSDARMDWSIAELTFFE